MANSDPLTVRSSGPSAPAPVIPKPTQQSLFEGRTYIHVDLKQGTIGWTSDRKLASSPTQIHQFIKQHFDKLKDEDAKFLLSANLKGREFVIINNDNPNQGNSLRNKIDSICNFISNLGTTDATLMDDIQRAIRSQKKLQFQDLQKDLDDIQTAMYRKLQGDKTTKSYTSLNEEIGLLQEKLKGKDSPNRQKVINQEVINEFKNKNGDLIEALKTTLDRLQKEEAGGSKSSDLSKDKETAQAGTNHTHDKQTALPTTNTLTSKTPESDKQVQISDSQKQKIDALKQYSDSLIDALKQYTDSLKDDGIDALAKQYINNFLKHENVPGTSSSVSTKTSEAEIQQSEMPTTEPTKTKTPPGVPPETSKAKTQSNFSVDADTGEMLKKLESLIKEEVTIEIRIKRQTQSAFIKNPKLVYLENNKCQLQGTSDSDPSKQVVINVSEIESAFSYDPFESRDEDYY